MKCSVIALELSVDTARIGIWGSQHTDPRNRKKEPFDMCVCGHE